MVADGQVSVVGEQLTHGHSEIRVREHRPSITLQQQFVGIRAAFVRLFVAVTVHAQFVEDRLNVSREIKDLRTVIEPFDQARRTTHGQEITVGQEGLSPLFVAPDATGRFARLHGQEALHALDRHVVLVQGDEKQGAQSGKLHAGRPIRLDRNSPQNAFQSERSAVGQGIHPSGVVDGLGQGFQDKELLDLSAFHAFHGSPVVHVDEHKRSRLCLFVGAVGDNSLALPRHDGPRFMTLETGGNLFGAQAIDFAQSALAVHQHDAFALSGQEHVFGKGPGVTAVGFFGDGPSEGQVVGAFAGIDHRDDSVMFPAAVAGRKNRHDFLRLRDRLGIDHDRGGMHVAVIDHLAGPIRVRGPKVMIVHLRTVDVFPSLIQQASVGQRPRRVVVLEIRRNGADVRTVCVAAVQHGHLGQPALDPTIAAAGYEDDPVVGQVTGLEVVMGAVGQLPQIRAIHIDFVEVIVGRFCFAVRKEDLLSVIMDDGIAHRSLGILEDRRHLAGSQFQPAQLPAVAIGQSVLVVRVVTEVGVPVPIFAGLTQCEDDFLDALVREILQQQLASVSLGRPASLGSLPFQIGKELSRPFVGKLQFPDREQAETVGLDTVHTEIAALAR